jgi:hypothetical protein
MHWQDHAGGAGTVSNSAVNINARSDPSLCGRRRPGADTLSHRQISVVEEELAVSRDGMEMFGVLDLAAIFDGCRSAIGVRNANNTDFGWHELSGYECSCVTILRLGEISVPS